MNAENEKSGYDNNQPDGQNLYNQDNQKNPQNPYGNQNGWYNNPSYNPYYPYGNQPYGPPPPPYMYQNNQNEFEMRSVSVINICKAYIWLYFIAVALFFIACVLAVTDYSYDVKDIFLWEIFILAGSFFVFVNCILSIILAVKDDVLSRFSMLFSTPFAFFIVGIFINLFSVIAAFMTLSRIKKAKQHIAQHPLWYQNEFEMRSVSVINICKAYIWLYFIDIAIFFIAIVLTAAELYDVNDPFWSVGVMIILTNCVLSIILAVKINVLSRFSRIFSTLFVFFIIGIFINLFSIIAAFMTLSRIKKAKQPIPLQSYW